MISREKRAQIKELKDELNSKLAKGFQRNPNMESFYFKSDNDRYISISQFKLKPKGNKKSLGQEALAQLNIEPRKLIHAFCGMDEKRWTNIMCPSSAIKYISKQEAELFGNICGIDGIKFFRDAIIEETKPVYPIYGFDIDSKLLFKVNSWNTIHELFGLNDAQSKALLSGRMKFFRKEVAEYIAKVICIYLDIEYSELYIQKVSRSSNIALGVTKNAIAISQLHKKEVAIAEQQKKEDQKEAKKNDIIAKLLDDLKEANDILSIEEYEVVERYISGLKLAKKSRNTLLSKNNDNFLEVSFDNYPKVVDSKTFNEVIKDSTKDDINTLVELYKEGSASINECADILCMNPNAFRNILVSKGIEIKRRKNPDTFNEKFQDVYWRIRGKTLSVKEGAKELGISYQALWQRMLRYDKIVKEVEV